MTASDRPEGRVTAEQAQQGAQERAGGPERPERASREVAATVTRPTPVEGEQR